MQIDLDLLYSWGAVAKKYKKNEIIFDEDEVEAVNKTSEMYSKQINN